MATLKFDGKTYTVDHAVKGPDYVHGYSADGTLVISLDGVSNFSGITYSGTYLAPGDCVAETCNDVKYCGGLLQTADGRVSLLPFIEDEENPGCYYRMVGNVREWLNPPMENEVVYRTTERWLGKPVYVTSVSYVGVGGSYNSGSMPGTGGGTVACAIEITGAVCKYSNSGTPTKVYGPLHTCTEIGVNFNNGSLNLSLEGAIGYKYDLYARAKVVYN